MSRTLTVAVHEFKTMFRRRMFQIVTAAVPMVALGALAGVWVVQNVIDEGAEAKDKVGYVDGTDMFTGHAVQGDIEFVRYADQDAGMAALLADRVDRLYMIPADYLRTGLVRRIEVGLGFNFDGGRDAELRGLLVDNLLEAAPDSEVVRRLTDPLVLASVAVDSEGRPRDLDEPRLVFFQALALLFFLSLAMTGGFLLQGLGEEKESRIMEVLLSSVSAGQFMAGKIVGIGAAGLSQILIWVASGRIILALLPSVVPDIEFSVHGVGLTVLALAFFVLGYLLFATLMAGVGAVAPTARESQQLSIIVVAPLVAVVYSSIYIVENPTSAIVRVLTFLPLTAPLVVLERLGPEAIEAWEIAVSFVILALSVWAAMFLVARIFRAFLLSYGKRPGFRLMWRTLVRP